MYEYPRCGTCRKAKKFLDAHSVAYTTQQIVQQPPSKPELAELVAKSGLPLKKFFNTSGKLYRELNMKEKVNVLSEDELLELLAAHGMLIKRPIVTDGVKVTVGFNEETFKEMWLV
ncbi:arsenate reductase family protein [Numidum massiliense]|uniref:arsenate reductase family protein n=1 Tax=Numidum massiliense TaxID=1522315 RepID=UPI0006D54143|nr:arsenate reductase family protein [Numidum massiliense]